ncbi:MAG: HAMP domain-containing protein [Desulfobacteraceae bacterium]|nr:HAMP domain-containing protein [Desulfobacteraceae bacterium]
MKKNGFSHIRRWLWLYVLLVVLTTLAAYICVYNELTNLLLSPGLLPPGPLDGAHANTVAPSFAKFKLRILFLLTSAFLAILFLSMIWARTALHQIHRPIHAIRRAVTRLAQGKLNETVTLDSNDELGQIGAGLNELAANLQELLLYIWKQSGQCVTILEGIKSDSRLSDAQGANHLDELTSAINNLREMAKAYVFYDVRLDGEQAVAIHQPGNKEGSAPAPTPGPSIE